MKRSQLEKEIEATLNNLRDIKSNKLKAQCLVDTLLNMKVYVEPKTNVPKVASPVLNKYFKV